MNFVDLQTRFIGPQMCVNYIFKTFLDGRKEGKQTSRLGSARAEMFCQHIFGRDGQNISRRVILLAI